MSKKTLLCLVALSLLAECGAADGRTRTNGVLYEGVNTVRMTSLHQAPCSNVKAS